MTENGSTVEKVVIESDMKKTVPGGSSLIAEKMYFSITGNKPPESLDRLADDLLVPPSGLGIEISESLEQAMMKALKVKAEDRYQAVEEYQADLMREPVVAVTHIQSEVNHADRTDNEPAIEDVREDIVKVDLHSDSTDSGPSEKTFKVNYIMLGVVAVVFFTALGFHYSKDTTIPVGTDVVVSEDEPVTEAWTDAQASEDEPVTEAGQVVGTINWDEGFYTGELIDGVPNGEGNWIGADGSSYDDNWYEGRFFGNGIYKHPDGTTEEGLWAHGQLPTYYIEGCCW